MSDDYTITVHRFDPEDPRLGRHVVHDSRSLQYRFRTRKDPRKLASVRHQVHIPILDQGALGSCTGHAGTAALASEAFWSAGQGAIIGDPHAYAVDLYSAATQIDPWPGAYVPEDTGSDGLSIAKVLHARGLISGFQHATSLEAALAALAERVVMIGSSWLTGMYNPAPDGCLNVSGETVGGHEYVLDELDVPQQRVWMRNSWGEGWGLAGRAWMSWDDLGKLLADWGDCTVLVPRTEPAPQPGPAPTPKPELTPTDRALADALRRFVDNKACPKYLGAAAEAWLKDK